MSKDVVMGPEKFAEEKKTMQCKDQGSRVEPNSLVTGKREFPTKAE